MTRHELNDEYFEWMCRLVAHMPRYRKLLRHLHNTDFSYILPRDGNRAEDGIELRYRFGYENAFDAPVIASCLDDRPCSVLEMMVALAIRCEEHIMEDQDIGDRTGQWFWMMIDNLGLSDMTNDRFDVDYIEEVLDRFHNREYKRNGEGGLFAVRNCTKDMRSMEIWYQLCTYLDDIL